MSAAPPTSEICLSAVIPVKRRQADVMGSLSLCGAVHCELPWEVLKASLVSPLPPAREGGAAGGYSSCLAGRAHVQTKDG